MNGLCHDNRRAFLQMPDELLGAANAGTLPTLMLRRAEWVSYLFSSVTYQVDGGPLDEKLIALTWNDGEHSGVDGWPYTANETDEGEPEEVFFIELKSPGDLGGIVLNGATSFSAAYRVLRGVEAIEALIEREGMEDERVRA